MRLRFVILPLIAVIAAMAADPTARAQESGANRQGVQLKFAVIDMDRIVKEAKARAEIERQLDELRQKVLAEAREEEEKLRQANMELARQRSLLSPEAHEQKRREFNEQMAAAQRRVQASRIAIAKAEQEAIKTFQRALGDVIAEVAQKHQITLLLRRREVVVSPESLDIASEVLARLDEALPAVKVRVDWSSGQ